MHSFWTVPHHTPDYYVKLVIGFLAMLGMLGVLQIAPRQYRKTIIGVFTFLAGLYYAAEFFWPATGKPSMNPLTPYQDIIANITAVVGSFAIGLGVISLVQYHTKALGRRRPGWGNSIAFLIAFVSMTIFGLCDAYAPNTHLLGTTVTNEDVYKFLFIGGLTNLGSAMFAMIAFFIASAAYRAFRVRSLESSFLMLAALIVMLGSVSFGTALTNGLPLANADPKLDSPLANFRIENIAQWLLLQVNTPAQRGIIFGLSIGELAVALRLWLSLERGAYFDKEI